MQWRSPCHTHPANHSLVGVTLIHPRPLHHPHLPPPLPAMGTQGTGIPARSCQHISSQASGTPHTPAGLCQAARLGVLLPSLLGVLPTPAAHHPSGTFPRSGFRVPYGCCHCHPPLGAMSEPSSALHQHATPEDASTTLGVQPPLQRALQRALWWSSSPTTELSAAP